MELCQDERMQRPLNRDDFGTRIHAIVALGDRDQVCGPQYLKNIENAK